ncbi:AAA family ATPase [Paenibacillus tyrfis]|uniref:Endonuclease GajA/Old nuclease/RecF-like AAA domain-containing protein n=1 Tax=Paenibacillus tyrfis TaxID=1501230 RepID=A0A081NVP4_9BACL|nr:AAA family ATPase [Paenibacillus tyrfis]KEQ22517.1 hypothetical protein ET33_22785 [Paenibacillus tyrfis]
MFIKKIHIGKYKKLNGFEVIFSRAKNVKFNLSVLIGENGTAKTTILQAITNLLSDSIEKNKMIDSYMEYEINKDNLITEHTITTYDTAVQLPSNLIISSYTPIEKIYMLAKKSELPRCPIIYSEMGFSKLKFIIKEFVSENSVKTKKMNHIVDYIGYYPDQYFIEFSKSTTSTSTLGIFGSGLLKGGYDDVSEKFLETLDQNIEIESLIQEYELNIGFYDRSIKSRNILSQYIMKFRNTNRSFNDRSRLSATQQERVFLEYVYILLKIKKFSSIYSEVRDTYYKGNTQRLVHSSNLMNYFNGQIEFYRDLECLEMFNKYPISDLWFSSVNDTPDTVPLSYWSSGELSLFLRLIEIANSISENSLLLIDEPETNLHPKWINSYINILKEIIDVNCHVIIATHAPLIISDIPKESIILLKKEGSSVKQASIEEKTIGLEYEEILKKIFDVNEKEDTALESYEKEILKHIQNENIKSAIELYDQLGDSPTKFNLFLKIKKTLQSKDE